MIIKKPNIKNIECSFSPGELTAILYCLRRVDPEDFQSEDIEFNLFGERRRFSKTKLKGVLSNLEEYFKYYKV